MSPKVNKPKLADDLRRLRAECTPIVDRSLDLLDFLYQRLAVPELPHLDLAWEPYVDSTLYDYMTTVGNRCQHAHGGDEPVAGKRDCAWCDAKGLADERDAVQKWNAQMRHFGNRLEAIDTARHDHSLDDDRGWSYMVRGAYEVKQAILKRAAQGWLLTHPPPAPAEFAGLMATQGYRDFCPSRLCHVKCANPKCFDCEAFLWYAYVDAVLEYVSKIASFDARLSGLARSWGEPISLCDNIEAHPRRRCFAFVGARKRKAMNDFLAWARDNPAPDFESVRASLPRGPGNDENTVHPWCQNFACTDEYCNGLH